jgi:hypothetical protein
MATVVLLSGHSLDAELPQMLLWAWRLARNFFS